MAMVELAKELGRVLRQQKVMMTVAESCTGGWIGEAVTAEPGSSRWFDRGFVTYSNIAKREMLGVKAATLARSGAVSEPTARAMAEGALARSRAGYALAVTGIAGPGGGTPEKPVGTVCFAWAGRQRETLTQTHHFSGNREAIRRQAVETALRGMLDLVSPRSAVSAGRS